MGPCCSSASSYAASNVLGLGGTPFTTNSASASASASASSNTLASATAAFAAATSSGGSSFASASAIAGTGTPMVVAFGGTSEGGGGGACTDTPLPSNPPYTCQQQKGWGKCNMAEMVKGGYCAQTCGRCTPATTPAATAAPTATPATPAAGNPGSGIVYFKARGSLKRPAATAACPALLLVAASAGRAPNGTARMHGTMGMQLRALHCRTFIIPALLLPCPRPLQGFQDSWGSWSYSASFAPLYKPGVNGDQANCGAINQFGAFQAGTPAAGRAAGKSALQFWTDGPAAVLTVNLGSQSVRHSPRHFFSAALPVACLTLSALGRTLLFLHAWPHGHGRAHTSHERRNAHVLHVTAAALAPCRRPPALPRRSRTWAPPSSRAASPSTMSRSPAWAAPLAPTK